MLFFLWYNILRGFFVTKQTIGKYQKRLSVDEIAFILDNADKYTATELSKQFDVSPTAIRHLLIKHNISPKIHQVDRSRACFVCSTVFTPKSDDGIKKEKYIYCSKSCRDVGRLNTRRACKYTKEQLDQVIDLKQKFVTNKQIVEITGVNLNTVKSVIRENQLSLPKEQHQINAYSSKINNNPNAMADMRDAYKKQQIESYEQINAEIKQICLNNNVSFIKGLSNNKKNTLQLSCDKHGEFKKNYYRFTLGEFCPKCGKDRMAESHRYSFEYVKSQVESIGYTLLSTQYSHLSIEKLKINCPIHGVFDMLYQCLFSQNQRCPKCSCIGSKAETAVYEYIQSLGCIAKQRDRNILKPQELDIYIPSKQVGIEFDGLYWHSDLYKDNNYHYDKMKLGENIGIRVINIFEDEWENRQSQVKSFLRSILIPSTNRVYARKCTVSIIPKEISNEFLNSYHIQGKTITTVSFGLFYNEELVGVMTGSKHHRDNENKVFVLSRMAFKDDWTIVGGAGKLLAELLVYTKQNHYSKLVSWSDNRWSQGNVYSKLGFVLEENMKPDYSYITKNGIRMSKQSNKKSNLLKKGAIGKTESEMAKSLGYARIYDCGKKRWILNI
jgi:hypothetical protein